MSESQLNQMKTMYQIIEISFCLIHLLNPGSDLFSHAILSRGSKGLQAIIVFDYFNKIFFFGISYFFLLNKRFNFGPLILQCFKD